MPLEPQRLTAQHTPSEMRAQVFCSGIVHRDLKPDNVDPGVEGGERAKILDFGIAKLTNLGETGKTKSGGVMGTPVYMAPEQCKGASNVDGRADIYSLGCMLFQMLCKRPPFNFPSVGELFAVHLSQVPTPLTAFEQARLADPIPKETSTTRLCGLAPRRSGVATRLVSIGRATRPRI